MRPNLSSIVFDRLRLEGASKVLLPRDEEEVTDDPRDGDAACKTCDGIEDADGRCNGGCLRSAVTCADFGSGG